MTVGDVIACPNWYHSDHCTAPCENAREHQHLDCEWCLGAKRVRIVEEDHRSVIVEPLAPEARP